EDLGPMDGAHGRLPALARDEGAQAELELVALGGRALDAQQPDERVPALGEQGLHLRVIGLEAPQAGRRHRHLPGLPKKANTPTATAATASWTKATQGPICSKAA